MSILYRSAFDLADDIRSGKLTAVEVLQFFLGRVERLNPQLNAVVALDAERALARAAEADLAAARGESWGELHGVPMTIKDAYCTQGLVTVGGIPACSEMVPSRNAESVQRLLDQGAIVFGKTNVPFMSSDLQSYNEVYGVTNNPWDLERTPGGSSGGAAAALAAGLTPLELGSDIGGSIRTPSHFCGVAGHKPSYGIVSQRGHLPPGDGYLAPTDLSVSGPLATSVTDLRRSLQILAGPDAEDAPGWSLSLPAPSFANAASLKVAVWSDDEFCPVDPQIKSAIEAAAQALSAAGAQVDFSARPEIDASKNDRNYRLLLGSAMSAGFPDEVYQAACQAVAASDPADVSHAMLQMRAVALSHRDWCKENERRLQARSRWNSFFEDFDVLLCPVAPVAAFPHDHSPNMASRELQGHAGPRPYLDVLSWAGLTLNSYLPTTVVPVGCTEGGLPIGVQIVSRFMGDLTTLAAAELLEQCHRAFIAPAAYSE
jgi:amidase